MTQRELLWASRRDARVAGAAAAAQLERGLPSLRPGAEMMPSGLDARASILDSRAPVAHKSAGTLSSKKKKLEAFEKLLGRRETGKSDADRTTLMRSCVCEDS